MKKEKWTEDEVALLAFESDNFERKGGDLLAKGDFVDAIAKQLSAFANSDGGHIVLGAKEDRTFDGVDPFKGQTHIVEWLGQKIAEFVVPPLRDFRVHEVEKSAKSTIPNDRIVVVIDVERSNLAPHQAANLKHYYYRVDKQSKPAPHRYIELLFSKDKFPGPRVANAWLQTVINPLIGRLRNERTLLQSEAWGFDMHRPHTLPSASILLDSLKSGNCEQFFQNHEAYSELIKERDEKVTTLIREFMQCHNEISDYFERNFYQNITSVECLRRLKNGAPADVAKFRECTDRSDFLNVLFTKDDPNYNSRILSQCLINGTLGSSDYLFAPLWRMLESSFLNERRTAFAIQMSRIRAANSEVLDKTQNLLTVLEDERTNLCRDNFLPFEEYPITHEYLPY